MTGDRAATALADILDEIDWVEGVCRGVDFAAWSADRTRRYAVERSIEIISEASRRISDEDKALHPEIPWRAIAGIGNVLRHDYHATAPRIVWEAVMRDLPRLRAAIAALARRHG